jgi:hypothetical protein
MRWGLTVGVAAVTALLAGAAEPRTAGDDAMSLLLSIEQRRLWVIGSEGDTMRSMPVAVGSGRTLRRGGRTWRFATPRGTATVIGKDENPMWIPPDWHYIERAGQLGLALESIAFGQRITLDETLVLLVRDGRVGTVGEDSVFVPFEESEEIIIDGTLFIPPFGSVNRRVPGVLGYHRLRLSNGVGLHGTPDKQSIGKAVTHGCIRLHDEDVAWLYENVPVGTRITIY